jgi:late competence protein required for DNA uptake (superfamily II DNA/RNA helicase)
MFKAVKSNSVVPVESKIRVSYNNEKCYKCNKNNLIPITNEDSSVSYCKNCNIKVLTHEFINEDVYNKKIEENVMLSRIYMPSALKRESFNYNYLNLNKSI